MIQATISGERQVGFIELPDPVPKAGWALVKVHASALCTEYKAYLKGRTQETPGHEGAGEVVAVGETGGPAPVGDRVVILPQYPCGHCDLCLSGDYCLLRGQPGLRRSQRIEQR